MLPKPTRAVAFNPAYAPLIDLLDGVLVTPQEVSKHYRLSESHLSNLRNAGKGLPFVKLATGAVRYQLSDVVAGQIAGTAGPLTLDRIALALVAMRGLDPETREAVMSHLARAFAPGA